MHGHSPELGDIDARIYATGQGWIAELSQCDTHADPLEIASANSYWRALLYAREMLCALGANKE